MKCVLTTESPDLDILPILKISRRRRGAGEEYPTPWGWKEKVYFLFVKCPSSPNSTAVISPIQSAWWSEPV